MKAKGVALIAERTAEALSELRTQGRAWNTTV